jgi:hypothetical protein
MTNAASHQSNQDLSAAGVGKIDFLHYQGPAKLLEHSGTHLHEALLCDA